ncbi:MAG: hypothetical protein H6832_11660 [Planctomycetes bacterium]|nr:hypothetical protein [Planctomycetota bacterium]
MTITLLAVSAAPRAQDVEVGAAQAAGSAATRSLPAGKTLVSVELAPLKSFVEAAHDLPWIAFWSHPKVRGVFRFAASQNGKAKAFSESLPQLYDWACDFDGGVSGSLVFVPGQYSRPQPRLVFTAAGASGDSLRGFENGFFQILSRAREVAGCAPVEKARLQVPESPLAVSKFSVHEENDNNQGWGYRKHAYLLRRARMGALHISSSYMSTESDGIEKLDNGVASALAELVSLRRDAPDLLQYREPELREGDQILARGVLRFDENVKSPEHGMRESETDEMKAAGVLGWRGLSSVLIRGKDGGLREILDSDDVGIEGDNGFRALRGNGKSLGDVADTVPSNALAVARLTMDDAMMTRWLSNMAEAFRGKNELDAFFAGFRQTLGLKPVDASKGLEGVNEITAVILPPAPGVLAPEFCLMVPSPQGEDAARAVVTAFSQFAAAIPFAGRQLEVKTLGKGEDAVPYVDLKELFEKPGGGMRMGNQEETMIMKALFGGGFLSAVRVGSRLAVGCNPRTLRKLKRDVEAGNSIATRAGFAEKFPKGENCFLEAWFDWKSIVERAAAVDTLLPLVFLGRAVAVQQVAIAGEPQEKEGENAEPEGQEPEPKLVLPTTKDIAALVGEQTLRGTNTEFGHRIETEGSLVLSPTSSTVFGFVVAALDSFDSFLRSW